MKQLLPFKVGYETYALELGEIQEIVEQQRIDPFPGAPAVVAGAISFMVGLCRSSVCPGCSTFQPQRLDRV